jgi:uncharacterized protein
MNDTFLWILSAALIVVGLAGTVLPALPGTLFVLAGIVLGAWIDDFTRIGWISIVAVSVLAVIAWVLDYVAGLLGAKRAGASRYAIAGGRYRYSGGHLYGADWCFVCASGGCSAR